MRTVLFVDDDMLVLNRLRDIVDWHALGYVIAGQAMDGATALTMARRVRPDLIILDINMPRKDGISVAKTLKEVLPSACILILSNHDTFEYVRLTLRYGVNDYLLKHELTRELLTKKLQDIEKMRRQEEFEEQRHSYFAEVAKQQFLQELILTGYEETPRHSLMQTQGEFAATYYLPVALWITGFPLLTLFDSDEKRDKWVSSVINLVSNVLSSVGGGLITPLGNGLFALLFFFEEGTVASRNEKVKAIAALAKSNLHRLLNLEAEYRLLEPATHVRQLHQRYHDTLEAYTLRCGARLDMRDERRLIDALDGMQTARIADVCRQILAERSEGLAADLARIGCDWGREKRLAIDDAQLQQFQNTFRKPFPHDMLCGYVTDFLSGLVRLALNASNAGCSKNVQNAIAYIHEHFMEEGISLSAAAQAIGISTAHLSRQFGRETGKSFVDYLTAYRILVAKELMKEPGVKIKDVCKKVGFSNYNYFLRVFKKQTGQTVSQSSGEGNRD